MNCKLICRFNLVFFAFVLLILSPVCYASSNIKQTEYKPFTPSVYNDYEKKDNIYMDCNKRIFSRKKKSRIAHVNELKLKVKKSNACLHLVKRGSYYSICPDETTNPLFVVIVGEKRYWLAKTTITGKHVKQIVKHIRKYADDSIHINTGTHGSRNGETIFSNDLPEGADLKGFYDVNLLLEDLDTIRKIPNVSIHSMSSYSGDIYPKEANHIINAWCFSKQNFDKKLPNNNLPNLPHNVDYILKRTSSLENLHKNFQIRPIQVLTGFGGIGKSTLARLYADHYINSISKKSYYSQVWWIYAEDNKTMKNSIDEIIQKMGIEFNDQYNIKQGIDAILNNLNTSFSIWLLILDNVKEPKLISRYFQNNIKRGHLLITSRNTNRLDWRGRFGRQVNCNTTYLLTEDEAIELLERHCPINLNRRSERKSCEKILRLLGDFYPLSISQIGYYLRERYISNNIVNPYEKYYKALEKENNQFTILEKNGIESMMSNINQSIIITFNTTYEQIKKEEDPEVLRILRVISLLHPDGLDWIFLQYLRPSRKNNWIKSWVNDNKEYIKKEKAQNSVKCLKNYGVLLDQGTSCQTHRTIQAIMRYELEKDVMINYIEDQAIQLLETLINNGKNGNDIKIDKLYYMMTFKTSFCLLSLKYFVLFFSSIFAK